MNDIEIQFILDLIARDTKDAVDSAKANAILDRERLALKTPKAPEKKTPKKKK